MQLQKEEEGGGKHTWPNSNRQLNDPTAQLGGMPKGERKKERGTHGAFLLRGDSLQGTFSSVVLA